MDEKLEKALECCSRVNCCACPLLMDVNCMSNLYAEVKRYIAELEERLAIMQESMDEQKKRNELLNAVIPNKYYSIVCPKCEAVINVIHIPKYYGYCGQAVK